MKNKFIFVIDIFNNKKFQLYLKRANLIFAFYCIYFLYNKINDLNISSIKFVWTEVTLTFVFYLISGTLWSFFMLHNYSGKFFEYFFNWSYSKIGKYFPSGLLTFSVRINQDTNKSKKVIFIGLLEEQFLIPFIAIPPLFINLFLTNNQFQVFYLIAEFLIFYSIIKILFKKLNFEYISLLKFNLLFLLNYFVPILLFHEIAKNLNYVDPLNISIIYFLSICIGLFFIGVPAGIGIREFVFISFIGSFLPNFEWITFIIKVRMIFILFDIIFGIFGLLFTNLFNKK